MKIIGEFKKFMVQTEDGFIWCQVWPNQLWVGKHIDTGVTKVKEHKDTKPLERQLLELVSREMV